MAKRVIDEEMRFTVIINGDKAQKELFDLEKRNRSLGAANKDLRKEKAKLIAQGKKNTQAYKNLTAEISKNNTEIKENKSRMKVLQAQIGVTGLSMRQLGQRASQLRLQLANMIPGSTQYKRLQADLKQVNAQITKLRLGAKASETSLSKLAGGFNKYAALGASVIAGFTGVVLSIQKVIDYNGKLADAQSNVQKTTGLSADEVDKLTKKFGAFKTRTARIELLKLAEEAGRLGKDSVDDVLAFVKVANQIKVALGDDIGDEQIREVGKMVTIYKVGQKEGKNFEESMLALGSSINEVSASGSNQASYLVDFLKRTAGISDVAGIAAQDMIGLAAAFDEAGQSQEISATAINKFFGSAAKDVEKFAKVAGVSVKEYSRLLEEDANQALILFLKGIKQGDPTLEQMTARLKGIELGGTRGSQAISALAANVDNLETKQKTANTALKEATSLTNEYNLKNNNLAATIDKVKKGITAAFSSEFIINGISSLIGKLGQLIGVIDDVDVAFKKETQASYESAKANRELANESSELLNEYESLVQDGVEPTSEAKARLDVITTLLKNKLGDSVVAIDKETGALKLNTDAVREQIKIKRLSADEEASTLASRLKGVEESQKDLEQERKLAQAEVDRQQRAFNAVNKDALEALDGSGLLPSKKQEIISQSEGYDDLVKAKKALGIINGQIYQQGKREADLVEKLNELNYDRADINSLFNTDGPKEEPPKEGAIKTIDGMTLVYKNGKWEPLRSTGGFGSSGSSSSSSSKIDQAKKEAAALLKLQRETEDAKIALIADAFQREMAQNDANQKRKLQDLQNASDEVLKQYDEALVAGDTDLASTFLKQYHELYDQIELLDEEYQSNRNEILQKGVDNHIKTLQEQFDREEQQRLIAHNNELAALGDNDKAKKELQAQFDKDKLDRQKANQELLEEELFKIINVEKFKGFDLELLSEEQLQILKDRLASLGLSLSEINKLLAAMKNGDSAAVGELAGIGIDGNGKVDILGMNDEQWNNLFARTETLAGLIGKVGQIANAAAQAYSIYDKFVTASENKRLQKLEGQTRAEIEKQDRLLSNKLISKKQHDDAVKAAEKKLAKEKAEMEHKQAKREKAINVATILGNQAVAVSKVLAQTGILSPAFIAGVIALSGIQLALALAQPLPAKGFEKGLYNTSHLVRREQDGKLFNANYGGVSRSGLVNEPTLFLAGEGGKNRPELIINDGDLKQFDPELTNSLYRQLGRLGRVPGYQAGFYENTTSIKPKENQLETSSNDEMMLLMHRAIDVLERLEENGVVAVMSKDYSNIKKLREELDKLKKIESKSIIQN